MLETLASGDRVKEKNLKELDGRRSRWAIDVDMNSVWRSQDPDGILHTASILALEWVLVFLISKRLVENMPKHFSITKLL